MNIFPRIGVGVVGIFMWATLLAGGCGDTSESERAKSAAEGAAAKAAAALGQAKEATEQVAAKAAAVGEQAKAAAVEGAQAVAEGAAAMRTAASEQATAAAEGAVAGGEPAKAAATEQVHAAAGGAAAMGMVATEQAKSATEAASAIGAAGTEKVAAGAEQGAAVTPPDLSAAATEHAKRLYDEKCLSCHGASGKGDGPVGKFLDPKPSDFAAVLKGADDASIAKVIKEGGVAAGKSKAMPEFSILSDEQIAGLVQYCKTLSANWSTLRDWLDE
jgi:mono/diheme cytochrome c family protein